MDDAWEPSKLQRCFVNRGGLDIECRMTPLQARCGPEDIALLFHDRGTRRGVSGQQHAPAALYPRERPGTHFTGGWVGPRAGLDGRKVLSLPGFDTGPSNP